MSRVEAEEGAVALRYMSKTHLMFSGNVTAFGGKGKHGQVAGTYSNGGCGTVFFNSTLEGNQLIIDNNELPYDQPTFLLASRDPDKVQGNTLVLDKLVLLRSGKLAIANGVARGKCVVREL